MTTTTALPASETQAVALLEPCFFDLIAAIEQAQDLPEQTRRHWVCSVRQIAKWLDRPAAVIPARWQRGADFSRRNCITRGVGVDGQDAGEPQIECAGGAALVRQGARRPAAGRAPFARVGAFRDSNWKGQFGSGSTIWFATARPAASDQPRSTTRSLMSIGATAPRTPAGQRTIPPGALWCGPGMPVGCDGRSAAAAA